MLNLLTNLNKFRNFDIVVTENLILLFSFMSGSVLFWVFGLSDLLNSVFFASDVNFCVAIIIVLALIMLSGFSQLGAVQIAVLDAVLEFSISAFVFDKLSNSGNSDSVYLLCLQVFTLFIAAIFCSQRSLNASENVLRSSLVNKNFVAKFAVNLLILIALFAIVLIICLNAF